MVSFASDSAILLSLTEPPSLAASRRVWSWFENLQRAGVFELHPGYNSLLLEFDPSSVAPGEAMELARQAESAALGDLAPGPLVEIPAIYDGEDLAAVAAHAGLSAAEVIRLHASAEYAVAFLGFQPGFPYLLGLPKPLQMSRRLSPRAHVPPGSVAIAGRQAGIYPFSTSGGWQLLGRTEVPLFDPRRDPPARLAPGMRVRFRATESASHSKTPLPAWRPGQPVLEVLEPGLFSSLQDGGRPGRAHLGVSPGGAADPFAWSVNNRRLGNRTTAAAIEITLTGAAFRFLGDTWFMVSGAPAAVRLDGKPLPMWTAAPAHAGQVLEIGACTRGLRTYLGVRGGFDGETILGSRSAAAWTGRALAAGDILGRARDEAGPLVQGPSLRARRRYDQPSGVLHAVRGAQWDWFTVNARQAFFSSAFTVSEEADRLGTRLTGPPLALNPDHAKGELVSEGIANGAVQVAGRRAMVERDHSRDQRGIRAFRFGHWPSPSGE